MMGMGLVSAVLVSACDPSTAEDLREAATSTTLATTTTSTTTTEAPPTSTTVVVVTTTQPAATTSTAPAATTTETTTPEATPGDLGDLPAGLTCEDLLALGVPYDGAFIYWDAHGRPPGLDPDDDGLPCEQVYPELDVREFTMLEVEYFVVQPTYFPPPEPGAGDNHGSGCSPGPGDLPDGVWFGRITTAAERSIEFDLMCMEISPPGQENVAFISNSSTAVRVLPVGRFATVHAIAPNGGWERVPYTDWYVDPGRQGFCPPEGCRDVWLYVNSGIITEIVQLWFA